MSQPADCLPPSPHPGEDGPASVAGVAEGGLQAAVARKGSFLGALRAVAWSFFGMRRGADYERDVAQLNPVHVVIAGLVGAAAFVGGLVLLVQWVVASGVAK